MITIFGTLHLDPPRRDEAVRELQRLVDDSKREPGCTHYVVSADLVDPCTLYIFEEWSDREALEAHQQSEHFVAHQGRAAGHIVAAAIDHYDAASAERHAMGGTPSEG